MKLEKKVNNLITLMTDNVVCFTMNDVNCDAYDAIGFPFDVVSIYTNSEEIPATRCYVHSVQCCREDCGTDFCLKVIKTMNKTYKCDISVSDTDFCVYSLYDILRT